MFTVHRCARLFQPHRKKKSFIEKKKAVTFHLVHRSQKDPLAADEKAPQHVLLPATKVQVNSVVFLIHVILLLVYYIS